MSFFGKVLASLPVILLAGFAMHIWQAWPPQPRPGPPPTPPRPLVDRFAGTPWADPEQLRALATRTEPWPLRHYPPPKGSTPGCRTGEGLPVVIGQARLRLPQRGTLSPSSYTRSYTDEFNRLQARVRAMSLEAFCRGPTDWATAQQLDGAFMTLTQLYDVLDPRCYRPSLPGDPRPECDRPDSGWWWDAFVAGLPSDIHLQVARYPRAPDEPRSSFLRPLWHLPGRTLEPRPAGGWTLRDAEGRARAVVLPRLGGEEDTREPLIPSCNYGLLSVNWRGWLPPRTAEEESRLPRPWTSCEVSYLHRGVVEVSYRFYREVFDEPDVPALDLRVRRFVQSMLDGAEALPSPP